MDVYHFAQCLERKAQKLNHLTNRFEENTRKVIKKLKDLCFQNLNIDNAIKEFIEEIRMATHKKNDSNEDKEELKYNSG